MRNCCGYCYVVSAPLFSLRFAVSSLSGGKDTGWVKASSEGRAAPSCRALKVISTARIVLGGITTVAARAPLATCFLPVLASPSQPRNGRLIHLSRTAELDCSWSAFLAPRAMASFCATTASMGNLSDVDKRSHEHTALKALSWVHWPFIAMSLILRGMVSCIPILRCTAAEVSDGPWMNNAAPPCGTRVAS